jgi:hypothetical protein
MTGEGWWYSVHGHQFGPVSRKDAVEKALAAEDPENFMLWSPVLSDWRPLSELDSIYRALTPFFQGPSQAGAQQEEATTFKVTAEAAAAYIERYLAPQKDWYERKALTAKRWHYALVSLQMIATTSIPFVNYLTRSLVASTALAVTAAAATGFSQLLRAQERWVIYRSTASALATLQLHYELQLPPFDGPDRHDKLVAEGDRIMGEEGTKWMATIQAPKGSGLPTAIAVPIDR